MSLTVEGNVVRAGVFMTNCVGNPHVDFLLMSVTCLERDGWTYTQGGGRCIMTRDDDMKELVRFGCLYLLGATGRAFATVEATSEIVITASDEILLRVPKMQPMSPAVILKDGVSLQHLRAGQKPYDPTCTTCQILKTRAHQHRRTHAEPESEQVSAN